MNMTEISKLELDKIPTQKNLVSGSFVIDMELESFVHGGKNKESNPNSRITLQKSLSRKGSMPSNSNSISNDSLVSSPSSTGGSPEKLTAAADGSTDHSSNQQIHHHMITVTSGATESRFNLRRDSFRRPPLPWTLNPKRILFLFATLSSMGSVLLIYFTLSICGMNPDVNALD